MAAPNRIRELRIKVNTALDTNHLNAATGSWAASNASILKPRIVDYDDSGLVREGIDDETMQTRKHAKPAPIPGLSRGSVRFSMPLGGAYDGNVQMATCQNVMSALLGGAVSPTARTTNVAVGSTDPNVAVDSNCGLVAGGAVLIGVKGDGRGGGFVYAVTGVESDNINVVPYPDDDPADGDQIVAADTVYLADNATQLYIDGLSLGWDAADQRQWIGGAGAVSISGIGVGELPRVDFDLSVADHRWVPSTDRTSLSQSTSPSGTDYAFSKGTGLVHIADQDGSSRSSYKIADLSINPGIVYDDVPEPAGINGVGDMLQMPSSPTVELTVLEDYYAFVADWEAGTAKHVIVQLGSTKGKCVAFEMEQAYLVAEPVPATAGNLRGAKLVFRADERYRSGSEVRSSALRIHFS